MIASLSQVTRIVPPHTGATKLLASTDFIHFASSCVFLVLLQGLDAGFFRAWHLHVPVALSNDASEASS